MNDVHKNVSSVYYDRALSPFAPPGTKIKVPDHSLDMAPTGSRDRLRPYRLSQGSASVVRNGQNDTAGVL